MADNWKDGSWSGSKQDGRFLFDFELLWLTVNRLIIFWISDSTKAGKRFFFVSASSSKLADPFFGLMWRDDENNPTEINQMQGARGAQRNSRGEGVGSIYY